MLHAPRKAGPCLLNLCLFIAAILFTKHSYSQTTSQIDAQYADSSEPARLAAYLKTAKSNFFSNRPMAFTYANKALQIAESKNTYLLSRADLYNLLGIITMYDEKYEEAANHLQKSVQLATENNFTAIKQKALVNIALNYLRQGDYQKSLQANFIVLPLLKETGEKLGEANCLANIANAFSYLKQFNESIKYSLEALKIFEELKYTTGIGNAYNTLGSNFTAQKNYAKAIEYLQKSVVLKKASKDEEALANSYLSLGTLYYQQKNYPQTFNHLKIAEAIFKKIGNKKGLMKAYTNLGVYYAKIEDYEAAKKIELQAVELSKGEKDNYVNTELYSNISQSYARLNDMNKAFDFSTKANESKDSLMNLTIQKQIADMQVRYETERKERALKEQQLLVKGQQLQLTQKQFAITKKNYIIAGGTGLLLLLCLIFYLGYRRYKWKQEARLQSTILKQQELATRAVLEAEETERQRIAKDLHDGVGQMMSAAKMNLSAYEYATKFVTEEEKLKFERIIQLVDESCTEVRAVSHNMMPNALLKNSLAAAIREFISKLDNRQLAAHLYTEGLDERLDSNIETILYRVVQECVNNVIKHSGASTLDISIIKEPTEITVTVEDNGRGFDVADKQKNGGIGLKNIRTRIDYLKGTVDFDSAPQRGTLVALHVPL